MNRVLAFTVLGVLLARAASAGNGVDYVTQIKPILAARCYACHSALRQQSGLRLDTAALITHGGDGGEGLVPGNSQESLLVQMITGELGVRMPPEEEGDGLSADQVALIKRWIDDGAPAPEEAPPADPRDHWAYHPPVRPPVPQPQNQSWVTNPIDSFIAAGHEAHELNPVGSADRGLLLRRVYLDLTGLPPTRDELLTFLANESPDAYARVVERLLESPQYGERWARHWMDIWRYSDWSGYQQEVRNSARHIWRWRDWIIESLNADKGYDRMVMEMLAGDEVAPADRDTLRATGFLARNWYKFNRNTWLDNTVEHTAKAFLGVTMNCARCHDHKYDPLSQLEYYELRAIFEPHDVRTDRVPGEPDLLKDGLARVGDLKPEEPTFLFERGNELRPVKENSLRPGVPEVLGGELQVEPIDLPVLARYPALQAFAIEEDLAKASSEVANRQEALVKAQAAVAAAIKKRDSKSTAESIAALTSEVQTAVALAELAIKQLATARSAQAALAARIDAEKAKYDLLPDADAGHLAVVAGQAERELALCQAQEQQFAAEQEHERAKAAQKPGDEAALKAVASTEAKRVAAAAAVAAAHAAMAEPSPDYQALGEQLPATSTGRRLAFAKWIVDRKNPLAARVAINHIWFRHFGAPLVDSAFDFGLRSPQPRNQPLLDWLAVELMDHNWQMKHIHRLIVTSSVYRMKSRGEGTNAANVEFDPDNRLLWRMNSRRLEAEAVRDALFHVAGNLDLSRGGPELDNQLTSSSPRRSIYFRHAYEKQAKFLEVFDGPSVNECYRRSESIVPLQALALANSDVSIDQSRRLAEKLSRQAASAASPDQEFILLAYQQILNRDPSSAELDECESFLTSQTELLRTTGQLTPFGGGAKPAVAPAADPRQRAKENLTHVLYNHNDFVTIR